MKYPIIIFIIGIWSGCYQFLIPRQNSHNEVDQQQIQTNWPGQFDGVALIPLPMTEVEKNFQRGFPGSIATFQCGQKQVILRRITQASRKLHPSADCLRASGHQLGPVHIHSDDQGRHWAGCSAKKAGNHYLILERITDQHGGSWTDVSSWYWHALVYPDRGPWLAQTIIQHHPHP